MLLWYIVQLYHQSKGAARITIMMVLHVIDIQIVLCFILTLVL